MSSDYKYHVLERSLSQNTLTKYIWNPILDHLPASLKPNTITVIGALFMLLSVVFIRLGCGGENWGFILAAICTFVAMAGDNVDGPHARRTGQSSKLGEYLDHWLDSINSVIVNLCIAFALGLQGWMLLMYLVSITVAFFATIWEHHHTGVFHSGRMGTNEGLLAIIGLYLLLFVYYPNPWFSYRPYEINIASILACCSITVCLVTIAKIVWRVRRSLWEFMPLLLIIGAICGCSQANLLDQKTAALLIVASNIPFCGRLLLERLADQKSYYRNSVALLLALLAFALLYYRQIFSVGIQNFIAWVGILAIIIAMLWDLSRAIFYLGDSPKRFGGI